jgi:DNA-binding transcriptional regulator YdaS (Cro superfamily)
MLAMSAIQTAVKKLGLAGIAGLYKPPISPQAVHKWGESVPEDRCPAIEYATEGAVTCDELRPDVSWVRVKDKDWPHPKGRPLVDHSAKTRVAA